MVHRRLDEGFRRTGAFRFQHQGIRGFAAQIVQRHVALGQHQHLDALQPCFPGGDLLLHQLHQACQVARHLPADGAVFHRRLSTDSSQVGFLVLPAETSQFLLLGVLLPEGSRRSLPLGFVGLAQGFLLLEPTGLDGIAHLLGDHALLQQTAAILQLIPLPLKGSAAVVQELVEGMHLIDLAQGRVIRLRDEGIVPGIHQLPADRPQLTHLLQHVLGHRHQERPRLIQCRPGSPFAPQVQMGHELRGVTGLAAAHNHRVAFHEGGIVQHVDARRFLAPPVQQQLLQQFAKALLHQFIVDRIPQLIIVSLPGQRLRLAAVGHILLPEGFGMHVFAP